jgi:hypothetical protein
MKLSQKDKEFLERLKELVEEDEVWIERTMDSPLYFVLKGNYGDHIESRFRLSRQGVRWRFWRLFNEMYVSAYETIIFIEKQIGTQYRQDALQIAHDQFLQRQRILSQTSFQGANTYRGQDKD